MNSFQDSLPKRTCLTFTFIKKFLRVKKQELTFYNEFVSIFRLNQEYMFVAEVVDWSKFLQNSTVMVCIGKDSVSDYHKSYFCTTSYNI